MPRPQPRNSRSPASGRVGGSKPQPKHDYCPPKPKCDPCDYNGYGKSGQMVPYHQSEPISSYPPISGNCYPKKGCGVLVTSFQPKDILIVDKKCGQVVDRQLDIATLVDTKCDKSKTTVMCLRETACAPNDDVRYNVSVCGLPGESGNGRYDVSLRFFVEPVDKKCKQICGIVKFELWSTTVKYVTENVYDSYGCPKTIRKRVPYVCFNGYAKVFVETPKPCKPANFYEVRFPNVELGCYENILSFRRVDPDCKEEKFYGNFERPICITNICVNK